MSRIEFTSEQAHQLNKIIHTFMYEAVSQRLMTQIAHTVQEQLDVWWQREEISHRYEAKEMEEAGVYSECVGKKTLDEAPGAYKDAGEIIDAIGDSVHIVEHMKPVFAFKDTTS